MNYKIEKVAVPTTVRNSYPFDKMKTGDSFLEDDFGKVNSLKVAATLYNKKSKKKAVLSVRKEAKGYRCFRIK